MFAEAVGAIPLANVAFLTGVKPPDASISGQATTLQSFPADNCSEPCSEIVFGVFCVG